MQIVPLTHRLKIAKKYFLQRFGHIFMSTDLALISDLFFESSLILRLLLQSLTPKHRFFADFYGRSGT